MKTCVFKNLPLNSVQLSVNLVEPVSMPPEAFNALYHACQADLPEVDRYVYSGINAAFSIAINQPPGARLSSEDRALTLEAGQNVVAAWQRVDSGIAYPGFGKLCQFAELAISHLGGAKPKVVVLRYVNYDQSGRPISELMSIPGVEPSFLADVVQYSVASRVDGVSEHRLEFDMPPGGGTVIRTLGGREVQEGEDWREIAEIAVHDMMQERFASFLTEVAKNEWQFDRVTDN